MLGLVAFSDMGDKEEVVGSVLSPQWTLELLQFLSEENVDAEMHSSLLWIKLLTTIS